MLSTTSAMKFPSDCPGRNIGGKVGDAWGRTPIVWSPSTIAHGYTCMPEYQDPWARAQMCMGIDYPDGWRDLDKWDWYYENVLVWWRQHATLPANYQPAYLRRKLRKRPDVTTMRLQGYAAAPRGVVTRFYVQAPRNSKGRWLIYDNDTDKVAGGTKQIGYATKEEAVEVAEELAANRPSRYSRVPF